MPRLGVPRSFFVAIISVLIGSAGVAQTQPDVLWLGVQERGTLPPAAASTLDAAIRSALSEALAPRAEVAYVTAASPRAHRALDELGFERGRLRDALGATEARALGVALGARATVRAWVEDSGAAIRLTTFVAAVHRRQAVIHQTETTAPPDSAGRLASWAQDVAGLIADKIAGSIRDVTRDAPSDAAGFAAAAERFLEDGMPRIAALEFNRAIAAAPKTAEYYLGSARAYSAMGEAERARRQLDIALKLDPDLTNARLELGRTLVADADPGAGAEELKRAVELGAGAEVRMELAAVLLETGDLEGAGEQYRKVAELDPANEDAAKRAAEIAAALASPEDIDILREATEKAPDSYEVRRKLIDAYAEQGESAEAVRQLRVLAEQEGAPIGYEPQAYVRIARLMDREMDAILRKARAEWDALGRAAVSRHEVSETIRALHERSDALARAAEATAAPPLLERGHRHRVLAFNLLNQSDFGLLRYLEREADRYYDEAIIARQAAVAERSRAWDLDAEAGWPTRTAAEE